MVRSTWWPPGNVSAEELESLIAHSQEHDHYEALSAHFTLRPSPCSAFRPWLSGFLQL